MIHHLGFWLMLLVTALVGALLEIQIEGGAGWASGLPTWRLENRWTRKLLGARAITGYHVHVHLFLFLLVHLPYALDIARPSLRVEARILAFLVLFWIIEDFLWFVVNPAFGLRKFRREHAWWHATAWWGIMPRDYWIFLPIGAVLYLYGWSII